MHVLYIQGINTGVQLKVYIYNLHIIEKKNLLILIFENLELYYSGCKWSSYTWQLGSL